MKVLIACEESQAVTIEFRKLGIEAFSCDIQECSGGHPEWHIKGDAIKQAYSGKYDLMVAFPPCTYLSQAGAAYWNQPGRAQKRIESLQFVNKLINAPIEHIAIENPLGIIDRVIRNHDQIIEPYYFGDEAKKRTCLWLKNLPKLVYTLQPTLFENKTAVNKPKPIYSDRSGIARHFTESISGGKKGGFNRSKTFPGIAKAMAEQWSKYIIES